MFVPAIFVVSSCCSLPSVSILIKWRRLSTTSWPWRRLTLTPTHSENHISNHIYVTLSLVWECCGELEVFTGVSTSTDKMWTWKNNTNFFFINNFNTWARQWNKYCAGHCINGSEFPDPSSPSFPCVSPGWASLFRPACCRLWATGAWWPRWRSCAGSHTTVKTPSTRRCWWRLSGTFVCI